MVYAASLNLETEKVLNKIYEEQMKNVEKTMTEASKRGEFSTSFAMKTDSRFIEYMTRVLKKFNYNVTVNDIAYEDGFYNITIGW